MRVTFRTKLVLVAGTAAVAILGVLVGSAILAISQTADLDYVEGRLVPKVELDPKLRGGFDQLRQNLQDAVAAQDVAGLEAASRKKAELIGMIDEAGPVLEPGKALELRLSLEEYHETAQSISRRMIAGETGEKIIDDMALMQAKYTRAVNALERAVTLSKKELAEGFAVVRDANRRAGKFRSVLGLGGLTLLIALSLWLGRGLLESLASLTTGFVRFSHGDWTRPIVVNANDELADLAREANQMAASLRETEEQTEAIQWLKDGSAALATLLRDAITPRVAAERALEFLSQRIGACAACLYTIEGKDLVPVGGYALEWELRTDENQDVEGSASGFLHVLPRFALGQGLLGQAALGNEVSVVADLPADYSRIRSALGDGAPRCLVFVPLVRGQERAGVVEFALMGEPTSRALELLNGVQEALVIALTAAQSRARLEQLLRQSRDLTNRLTAQEEELRASNEELHSQQQELRVANEELSEQREILRAQNTNLQSAQAKLLETARELEQVSAYKSQFLAKMSHELRTPLNSMLLLSQLLSETALPPEEVVEHAATINSAGNDLLALINQILDLAKIESGKQEMAIAEVRLQHFAAYAERVFRPLTNNKGIDLQIELANGLPEAISTDARRLERILTNLLGNAVKFTQGGYVRLRIARPDPNPRWKLDADKVGHLISFSVEDTGTGIAQEALERIFSPFEQVMEHRDRSIEGTGLGLSIAQESARLLGGDLYVESTLGRGTIFTCIMPEILTADNTHSLVHASPVAFDDTVDLSSGEPYLLIVEDDPTFAQQLVEVTHGRRLKAVVARSGGQALELARKQVPLGIILDVKLPDIDGFSVVNQLRQHSATASVPVHFISGVDAKQRGLHVGAIGYLVKPASRGELVGAVRSLVSAGSDESARVLVVEDDPRDGRSILEILRHERIDAEHVTSASAARNALRTEAFGCVILDLGLPDMDGLDLLESIATHDVGSLPRVIVYTGRALTRQEARRIEAYAEVIILKDGTSAPERLAEEVRLFVHHVEEAAVRKGQAVTSEHPAEVSLEGYKLLLVDDDMRTAFALSAILRSKGAEVLVGDTGKEALGMLAENPDVNAILMDVMMPEMDGYEAMRQIRKLPQHSHLPIIALTAKAMKGERERCLEAGASDYLSKPVNSRQLLLMLGSWLTHGRAHR
jgi:CheY-like chemotaxis protein